MKKKTQNEKKTENPAAIEKQHKYLPRQERFSPGWSYQPGLKILCPHLCAAATWMATSPGT